MCLLIVKPEGKSVPLNHLRAGYTSNPDGAGFAIAKDGKVHIFKGYFTFLQFIEAYEAQNPHDQYPALIHFRIGTSGKHDKDNCHPFRVGDMALGHNGVITDLSFANSDLSDTNILSLYLDEIETSRPGTINKNFITNLYDLITGNKISLLKPSGEFLMMGERLGDWIDDVWYSNGTYKPFSRDIYTQADLNYYVESSYSIDQEIEEHLDEIVSRTKLKKHQRCKECNKVLRDPSSIEMGHCVHCVIGLQRPLWEDDDCPLDRNGQQCDGSCGDCIINGMYA